MKSFILAAFAAIGLTASIAPVASAAIGLPHNAYQTGSYYSTNHGSHHSGTEGGGS
jgi:hypothetical protein